MTWNSLSLLTAVSSWALWVGAATAAISVAASLVSTVTANRAADIANRQAHERISEADARAAEATRRTEELKLEVERERVERLRLEKVIKPREISSSQTEIMRSILNPSPKGRVYINPDWTDPEAKLFGAQIWTLLERSGFSVSKLIGDSAPISFGKMGAFFVVRNGENQPPHLKPMYQAFKAAGFAFDVYQEAYVPDEESVLIGVSTK